MDDMTAFDRQLAKGLQRMAGPGRQIDAASMVRSVASRSRGWGFRAMFSATQLVVAGAILVLFGGLLLTGILTQPSEETMPAVGPSASALTQAEPTVAMTSEAESTSEVDADATPTSPDLLPGVDLVTEDIEPGVYRVLSDGTGNALDFEARDPDASAQVVTGQDGSVWVLDQSSLLRLGTEDWVDAARLDEWEAAFSVAPDGTLWALGADPDGAGSRQILSLSDGEWTAYDLPDYARASSIDVAADGVVWTTWAVEWDDDGCTDAVGFPSHGAQVAVARLVDGQWFEERFEPGTVFEDASLALGPDGPGFLDVRPCGDGGLLHRRQDDGWQPANILGKDRPQWWTGFAPFEVGQDGTVWTWTVIEDGRPLLFRMTDGAWDRFGDEEPVPWVVGNQTWGSSMAVSADGRLWLALGGSVGPVALDYHREYGQGFVAKLDGPCTGVLSFDGTAWTHHLAGACATHISSAPNGNVWVMVEDLDEAWFVEWSGADPDRAARVEAAGLAQAQAGIYVITPEAVAATE